MGNIKTVKENGSLVINYAYDDLNQLYIINDKTNKIYTHYYYDDAGNITSVLKRGYNSYGVPSSKISEDTYTYGDSNWKDKLTAFNGQTITYDEMGNPLSYRDGMSFTWVNGRRLNSVTVGNTTLNMKYDSNGMRTQKGEIHYYYDSNKNLISLVSGNNTLFFYYDSDGNPTSIAHNGTMYYYIKNLQGDIVKIANESGTVIINYAYDVSGEILSIKDNNGNAITDNTSVAILNPHRYRGYVYDDETGLYYLQSRYYDPVTERFLNADVYCDTQTGSPLSTNMYAYCENNATNHSDPTGEKLSIKAITYAQKWWDKRNPQYYSYGSDCANFVSQCLYAGGFCNMYGSGRNSGWHSYKTNKKDWLGRTIFDVSASWSLSNDLRFWIIKTMHYTQHLFTSMDQIKKAMKNINPGAVAFMSTDYNGNLSHSVLIGRITKSNVYFYAHTNSRDARKNDYGFAEYFRDKPKNKTALIAIFYLK